MVEGFDERFADGWWPGKGFVGPEERIDYACPRGHRVPYTIGQLARGGSRACPTCVAAGGGNADAGAS